ncbi:transcription factor Opi1-domain-containing protein [Tirmania nivea]|nr:transcription factor Opi1-domain-containing protein [Tirmania nivea]
MLDIDIPEERKALQKQPQDTQQQNWQTRLILSTSGIGAMSEESLKSLKYCLEWLRWANSHLGKCIETLKTVLEEYEQNKQSMNSDPNTTQKPQSDSSGMASDSAAVTMRNPIETEERKQMLMGRIERLKGEVLKTLKRVINVVDSYAGGALVGETRNMVKRQLLYLPQRLQIALVAHTPSTDGNGNEQSVSAPSAAPGGDPAASAQRVIIVAKEGLDMMHNVSKLVEIALVGAEEWCEKLGRKREPEEKSGGEDVKMVEAGQESTTQKDQIMGDGERRGEEGDVEMEG